MTNRLLSALRPASRRVEPDSVGKRNAGRAYEPAVDAGVRVPSLRDDPAYVTAFDRLTELQNEFDALERRVGELHTKVAQSIGDERKRLAVEASALTTAPTEAIAFRPREAVTVELEDALARRNVICVAIDMQRRLVDKARNRANALALDVAQPHHEQLVLEIMRHLVALSRALLVESDYRYAMESTGVLAGELMQRVPPGLDTYGRLDKPYSFVRRHLRTLEDAGYPIPDVPELKE